MSPLILPIWSGLSFQPGEGQGAVNEKALWTFCWSNVCCHPKPPYPHRQAPLFISHPSDSHSLVWVTSQTLSSTWGDHFGGTLGQNHQHIPQASSQNTVKGMNAAVERTRGHYLGSQTVEGYCYYWLHSKGGVWKTGCHATGHLWDLLKLFNHNKTPPYYLCAFFFRSQTPYSRKCVWITCVPRA